MKQVVAMSAFSTVILDNILPGTQEWEWCDRKKIASVPSALQYTQELEDGQKFSCTIQSPWFIVYSERRQQFCAILNQSYHSLTITNYGLLLQDMAANR